MSKYKKIVIGAGLFVWVFLSAAPVQVSAAFDPSDKSLHNHTKRVLGNHQRQNISKDLNTGETSKIKVFLPSPKPTLQPKKYWPARNNLNCEVQKCIALTFDDGPSQYTPELLDILNSKNAKATFFVVGSRVTGNEMVLRRMVDSGHEIGNHSFSHVDFRFIDAARIDSEILQTQNAIFGATGYTPHTFRPPYGALPAVPAGHLGQFPSILWNNDPEDWERNAHHHTAGHVAGNAVPGGIVLMHDLYPETINSIPAMIDTLRSQGFEFVTVTELFGWKNENQVPKGQIIKNR